MIKNIQPTLSEYGKIKIGKLGAERQTRDQRSTYRLPVKLDHFIITKTEKGKDGNFVEDISLMKQIAETVDEPFDGLKTIPVYLIFNDLDRNFFTTYNCYKGKTRICSGDGETATVLTTGEQVRCPCPRLAQGYKGTNPCKPYGRLSVVLQNMNIVGGSWVYRTTGWNSVQGILGSLLLIRELAGRLSGIPLMMKLLPKTTQIPTGAVTIYTVSLIYMGSNLALIDVANKMPALIHDTSITPDQAITPEEEAEIQEEFYPPAGGARVADVKRPDLGQKERKEPTAAELAQKVKTESKPEDAPPIELSKPLDEPAVEETDPIWV